jgi:homoserine kinase
MLSELWREDRKLADRVRLHIDSDIPLGSGLGGRTSAILGALWAHNIFNERIPTTSDLLSRMAELEGHTETFAAALIGDFVVSARVGSQNRVVTRQLIWPADWATIVVIPDRRLSTSEARAVLPKSLPLHETIYNLQRTALLVSSVVSVDEAALKEALHDRVHQPFRHELVPEFPSLSKFLQGTEAIGCVLCGGGPSLLVIVNQKHKESLLQRLAHWAQQQPSSMMPRVLDLEVDRQGIRETH